MIKDILKKIGGSWLFLMAVTLLYLATAFFDTQAAWRGLAIFSKLFVKILPTLAIVFGLLFVSNLLIDTKTVVRHLGKGAKKGTWLIAVVGGIVAAVAIGAIAGGLVVCSVVFIDRTLKIDDPVGAISVHGVCGAWGTLALGLFAMENEDAGAGPLTGLLFGGSATQLVNQAIGVGAVFAWCMVTGAVCFFGIKFILGLRVTPQEEADGLDFGEHGNEAYHGFLFTSRS